MRISSTGYAFLMLLAGGCFGIVSPLMKMAYANGFSAGDITNAQYLLGVITLWPLVAVWPKGHRASPKQWLMLLILGIAGAGTSYTYYLSLTKLPASLAIVLLFQFAWVVLVMDSLVMRKMPAPEKLLGIVIIVVGTILAVGLTGLRFSAVSVGAVLLGLLSSVFYSLTLYLSAFVDAKTSPTLRSAVTVTVSAIAIIPFFSPSHLYQVSLWRGAWWWGLLIALFSQTIPMTLMYIATPRIGGRMAGVLGSIELPVAVLAARLMLDEPVTMSRWFGVLLILCGIVVSEWDIFHRNQRVARVQS